MSDDPNHVRETSLDLLEKELIKLASHAASSGRARDAARLTNSLARLIRNRKTEP